MVSIYLTGLLLLNNTWEIPRTILPIALLTWREYRKGVKCFNSFFDGDGRVTRWERRETPVEGTLIQITKLGSSYWSSWMHGQHFTPWNKMGSCIFQSILRETLSLASTKGKDRHSGGAGQWRNPIRKSSPPFWPNHHQVLSRDTGYLSCMGEGS